MNIEQPFLGNENGRDVYLVHCLQAETGNIKSVLEVRSKGAVEYSVLEIDPIDRKWGTESVPAPLNDEELRGNDVGELQNALDSKSIEENALQESLILLGRRVRGELQ